MTAPPDLKDLDQQQRALQQQLREQEREARRWQQSAEAKQQHGLESMEVDAHGGDADGLIAELSAEISRLKEQIALAQAPQSAAGEAAAQTAQLRERLAQVEKQLALAQADPTHEQNQVAELERERELQNKSLQVLHQQLDLERTRRVANG